MGILRTYLKGGLKTAPKSTVAAKTGLVVFFAFISFANIGFGVPLDTEMEAKAAVKGTLYYTCNMSADDRVTSIYVTAVNSDGDSDSRTVNTNPDNVDRGIAESNCDRQVKLLKRLKKSIVENTDVYICKSDRYFRNFHIDLYVATLTPKIIWAESDPTKYKDFDSCFAEMTTRNGG